MNIEITVRVVAFGNRKYFQMRYICPLTGKQVNRSTGVLRTDLKRDRTEAERVAAKWEAELREGRYRPPSRITWEDFRQKYEDEKLNSLAANTNAKAQEVLNGVEKIIGPARLSDLTAARLSHFQSKLREHGLAESSIAGQLAYLRAALQWAVDIGLLAAVPKIQRPQRAKGSKIMKGRPITLEEFERMLDKVEAVVGPAAAPSWRFYLRGLWTSGLRLAESMELYWDRDDKLCVDLDGKRPMLRIPGALEKGNQDRLLPMAPEFAELLAVVPEDERTGPVFDPKSRRRRRPRLSAWSVSTTVSEIGKAAGVKVDTRTKVGKVAVKFASAHDAARLASGGPAASCPRC